MFQQRSDENVKFIVVSTHFDHVGVQARINSAQLLKNMLADLRAEHRDTPVLLAGDFNSIKVFAPRRSSIQL